MDDLIFLYKDFIRFFWINSFRIDLLKISFFEEKFVPVHCTTFFMVKSCQIKRMNDSIDSMASVAKWLRQWVVIPSLAGSIPVVRPYL